MVVLLIPELSVMTGVIPVSALAFESVAVVPFPVAVKFQPPLGAVNFTR